MRGTIGLNFISAVIWVKLLERGLWNWVLLLFLTFINDGLNSRVFIRYFLCFWGNGLGLNVWLLGVLISLLIFITKFLFFFFF